MGRHADRPYLGHEPPDGVQLDADVDDVALIAARVWPVPANSEVATLRTALARAALRVVGTVEGAMAALRQAGADATPPTRLVHRSQVNATPPDEATLGADLTAMDRDALVAAVIDLRRQRWLDEEAALLGTPRTRERLERYDADLRARFVTHVLLERRDTLSSLFYDRDQLEAAVTTLRVKVAEARRVLRALGSIVNDALGRGLLPESPSAPRDDAETDS